MMDERVLDLYALRGILGVVKMLEDREGPVAYDVKELARDIRTRLVEALDRIEAAPIGQPALAIDANRLDRWLIVGAGTFVDFIDARSYNDQVPARLDLPIRAMIEKLTSLQKRINSEGT